MIGCDYETFELGDVQLQSGRVLKSGQLAYKTYGVLNERGDNAVVLPTFYTGTHVRNELLFGPGRAIDPSHHFVVSINLFGNGYSSSPSNTPPPQDGPRFPHVTLHDNIACQHRLLTERLGVRRIALVLGWSAAAVVAETNFGGAMVREVIRTAQSGEGLPIPFREVTASRGKAVRAEPIAALFQQGKVSLVGRFQELEYQLCAMTTAGYRGDRSPDRADAMVWGLTAIFPAMTREARASQRRPPRVILAYANAKKGRH